ncbi:hypothetical protein IAT38_005846 [Cryptococcus sp. DSM 104549]
MAAAAHLSGRPGHLTDSQKTALASFRSLLLSLSLIPPPDKVAALAAHIGHDRYDDATLLRFLRARKFDVEKAKVMWEANEKWRKDFGTDEIAAHGFPYPEHLAVHTYYPQYYHKTDKLRRPIYIEQLGKLDMPKLYAATTLDRLVRRLVAEYERFFAVRCPACEELPGLTEGERVETSCTILDLKGVSLANFVRVKDYIIAASTIGQNYCESADASAISTWADSSPETMGHMFIINAPPLFPPIWNLIKPWLDESTVRKVRIIGKNYKPELLKFIDEENLPAELGGKCRCPGKGGCGLSDAGPWVGGVVGGGVGWGGAWKGGAGADGAAEKRCEGEKRVEGRSAVEEKLELERLEHAELQRERRRSGLITSV